MTHSESESYKPNFYAIIPADVRYCKELEPSAKLLYGEITALSNREGYCWASNEYFASTYDVDIRTIKRWLESLKECGFISIVVEKNGFNTRRKIFIFKEISTKGQKCPPREDKNVPLEGDKNVPHNNTKNNTSNKYTCADSVDAPISKKSKEKISIERITRRPNVHTSDEEHQSLIKKLGSIEILEKCYDHLSEWKKSISESDKKAAEKHTDYYRIPKWVAKAVQESETKKQKVSPIDDKKSKVIERFKHGKFYNGAECFLDNEAIGFQRGSNHMSVKFKELGFFEQYNSMCRKFGIDPSIFAANVDSKIQIFDSKGNEIKE